jgi:hypothetical protein
VRALRFHHAKEPRETERKANDAQQNSGESKVVLHYANLFNCSDDVIPFLLIIRQNKNKKYKDTYVTV